MKKITVIIALILFISCKKEISTTQNQVYSDSVSVTRDVSTERFEPGSCGAGNYTNIYLKLPGTSIFVPLSFSYNGSRVTSYTVGLSTSTNLNWWSYSSSSWLSDSMGGAMNGWVSTPMPSGGKLYSYNWDWSFNPATCIVNVVRVN